MTTFIFIAGAPGSGKSTIAKSLSSKLDSPVFEFGWIPEFRNTGNNITTYREDEALAFENLVLVTKNYAKHDFKNIIITDLENYHIAEIKSIFTDFDYKIFTLTIDNDDLLKSRLTDSLRLNGYNNYEEAIKINREILDREPFNNEMLIDATNKSAEAIVEQILGQV